MHFMKLIFLLCAIMPHVPHPNGACIVRYNFICVYQAVCIRVSTVFHFLCMVCCEVVLSHCGNLLYTLLSAFTQLFELFCHPNMCTPMTQTFKAINFLPLPHKVIPWCLSLRLSAVTVTLQQHTVVPKPVMPSRHLGLELLLFPT